jgi:REP element-mobilizing transposase RayT
LRENLPLKLYDQLLPHWRQAGATYFVTLRLADSLPQSKLHELRAFKAEWERRHPPPRSHAVLDEIARELFRRIEGWLDQGLGSCVLKQPNLAERVIEAMHAGDGTNHELGCYVVMANHVHAIVRPLVPGENDVEDVLRIWKGRSAYEINQQRGASGALWQRESYDRIIRDEEHLWRVIQYIGRNPKNAGLDPTTTPLWIRPAWFKCGWRFSEGVP